VQRKACINCGMDGHLSHSCKKPRLPPIPPPKTVVKSEPVLKREESLEQWYFDNLHTID
jgi:hypothetical protein